VIFLEDIINNPQSILSTDTNIQWHHLRIGGKSKPRKLQISIDLKTITNVENENATKHTDNNYLKRNNLSSLELTNHQQQSPNCEQPRTKEQVSSIIGGEGNKPRSNPAGRWKQRTTTMKKSYSAAFVEDQRNTTPVGVCR
jgi:hypothetical protein